MVFGWCDDLLVFDFSSWKSWGPLSGAPNKNRWNMERYHAVNGDFLKWWYPTTMGFPTKHDHFGMFCGYHHLGNTQIGELFFKRIVSAISLRLVKHSLIHLPFFFAKPYPQLDLWYDKTLPSFAAAPFFLQGCEARWGCKQFVTLGSRPLPRRWSMEGMVFGSWNA